MSGPLGYSQAGCGSKLTSQSGFCVGHHKFQFLFEGGNASWRRNTPKCVSLNETSKARNTGSQAPVGLCPKYSASEARSEESRVGKECWRWICGFLMREGSIYWHCGAHPRCTPIWCVK